MTEIQKYFAIIAKDNEGAILASEFEKFLNQLSDKDRKLVEVFFSVGITRNGSINKTFLNNKKKCEVFCKVKSLLKPLAIGWGIIEK